MRRIQVLTIIFSLYLFGLVGCEAPLPAEHVIHHSSTIEMSAYSMNQRNQACNPIYTPLGGHEAALEEAFWRYPADQPILWTFGLNFDVVSPAGNPLGCLRLYRRQGLTFVPIDNDGLLVDTCRPHPAEGGEPPSITEGSATFNGGSYECEMNLREWVLNRADGLAGEDSSLYSELVDFGISATHVYSNFTVVAAVTIADPVIDPGTGEPITRSREPVIMAYQPVELGDTVTFSLKLAEEGVQEWVTAPVHCSDPPPRPSGHWSGEASVWWYDLYDDLRDDAPSLLQYVVETSTVSIGCIAIDDPPIAPITFGIDSATLYIGRDANGENHFFGSMDGVLIDPTDSKPPA